MAIEKGRGFVGPLEFRNVSRASISAPFLGRSRDGSRAEGRSENPERNGSGVRSSGAEKRKKRGGYKVKVKSKKWKARMIKLRRRKRS